MPSRTPITCEIFSSRPAQARALAQIAAVCAHDLAQPLKVTHRVLRRRHLESVLTLHLPADVAATQNEVWCLACRLACFCPDARVSVLVQGENAFAASSPHEISRKRTA